MNCVSSQNNANGFFQHFGKELFIGLCVKNVFNKQKNSQTKTIASKWVFGEHPCITFVHVSLICFV